MRTAVLRSAIVVVLFGCLAAFAFGHRLAHRRFVAVRERVAAECAAFRAEKHDVADPCDLRAPVARVTVHVDAARADLADANAAVAAHDSNAARTSLLQALDRAEAAERAGTLYGSVAAARIVDAVLDVATRNRSELGAEVTNAVCARARLHGAERVLATMRLSHFSHLITIPDGRKVRTFAEALAANLVERNDRALTEMGRAVAARDLARCERAAIRERQGDGGNLYRTACRLLTEIDNVSRRIDEVRPRA